MKTKFFLSVVLIVLKSTVFGQQDFNEELDKFINQALSRFSEIPGISIAVVKNDKPIFIKSYGYSEIETKKKASIQSAYYIASTTKSFNGLLATILEKEGKLHLDKPLTFYAPFKYYKQKALFDSITIKELLTHTSGIENDILTWRNAYTGDYSKDDLLKVLEYKTKKNPKGKIYKYDNLGYNILDIILAEELGKNWKDLLRSKIFEPLKMQHTTAYMSLAERKKWDIVKPYLGISEDRKPIKYDVFKNDASMQAAGGLLSSISDASNWLLFNINLGKLNGKQLYPASLVQKTHAPLIKYEENGAIFQDVGYGLGWVNAMYKDEKVIYHFGGFPGFFSHISFMPENKLGIAVFSNESDFGDNVSNLIAAFAYDLLLNKVTSAADYASQMDTVQRKVASIQKNFSNDRANRSKRVWQLKYTVSEYAGEYNNKDYGAIKVQIEKDSIPVIKMGILKATATPFLKDNTMRVELIPGMGEPVQFTIENNKIVGLLYRGYAFSKK